MPEPVIYSKTPITEATIDIRIEPPDNFDIEKIKTAFSTLQDSYNYSGKKFERNLKAGLEDSADYPEVNQTHVGFRYRTKDQKQVLEVTAQSLSLSRLAPYSGWENFENEAQRLWSIFKDLLYPKSIVRVGVRYINQLDIPKPFKGLDEYLTTYPNIATA